MFQIHIRVNWVAMLNLKFKNRKIIDICYLQVMGNSNIKYGNVSVYNKMDNNY